MNADERHELQQIIREVVAEAVPATVDRTLERFGFTVSDATSMQQDMAHLRKMRRGGEFIKTCTIKTCIGASVTGMIYLLIEGFRAWLKGKGNL